MAVRATLAPSAAPDRDQKGEEMMVMHPVISDNVRSVGYDAATGTMRVAFRSGGVYDYYNVEPALFELMLQPHPWRRIGSRVRAHRYRRVAA